MIILINAAFKLFEHEIQKESWQFILSRHQKLTSMIVVANLEQEDTRTFEIGI